MHTWPFILGLTAIAVAPIAQAEDCNKALDQTSMNRCMAKAYEQADSELNRLYQQIMGRLTADADMAGTRKDLIAAQRAWIAFRDAECAFFRWRRGLRPRSLSRDLSALRLSLEAWWHRQ